MPLLEHQRPCRRPASYTCLSCSTCESCVTSWNVRWPFHQALMHTLIGFAFCMCVCVFVVFYKWFKVWWKSYGRWVWSTVHWEFGCSATECGMRNFGKIYFDFWQINNWFLNIFAERLEPAIARKGGGDQSDLSDVWICYSVELIFVHVYLSFRYNSYLLIITIFVVHRRINFLIICRVT